MQRYIYFVVCFSISFSVLDSPMQWVGSDIRRIYLFIFVKIVKVHVWLNKYSNGFFANRLLHWFQASYGEIKIHICVSSAYCLIISPLLHYWGSTLLTISKSIYLLMSLLLNITVNWSSYSQYLMVWTIFQQMMAWGQHSKYT